MAPAPTAATSPAGATAVRRQQVPHGRLTTVGIPLVRKTLHSGRYHRTQQTRSSLPLGTATRQPSICRLSTPRDLAGSRKIELARHRLSIPPRASRHQPEHSHSYPLLSVVTSTLARRTAKKLGRLAFHRPRACQPEVVHHCTASRARQTGHVYRGQQPKSLTFSIHRDLLVEAVLIYMQSSSPRKNLFGWTRPQKFR
jgi:hypothetical protein